jgi:hypothetical protein
MIGMNGNDSNRQKLHYYIKQQDFYEKCVGICILSVAAFLFVYILTLPSVLDQTILVGVLNARSTGSEQVQRGWSWAIVANNFIKPCDMEPLAVAMLAVDNLYLEGQLHAQTESTKPTVGQ